MGAWEAIRARLLVAGVVGALATLVALLPGSAICAATRAQGADCARLATLELVTSIALAVFGLGGALLVHVALREPA